MAYYPGKQGRQRLRDLVRPHVDSFDWFLDQGLKECCLGLSTEEVPTAQGDLRMWVESVRIEKPFPPRSDFDAAQRIFPSECRQGSSSYKGAMSVEIKRQLGDGDAVSFEHALGYMPIMVGTSRCHLRAEGMTEKRKTRHGEEAGENGGYFICNGNERLIRLLQVPRRNHFLGIERNAFKNRGPEYTPFAVVMRCVGPDQTSKTVALHMIKSGSARLRLTLNKNEFFIPAVTLLRAMRECTDREIYSRATGADDSDDYIADRVLFAIQEAAGGEGGVPLYSQGQCLAYLGSRFRSVLLAPRSLSDIEVGQRLIRQHVFIHLPASADEARWELLMLMLQRLYALASGRVRSDNPDSLVNQELLLPGHLWAMMFKEQLGGWLKAAAQSIEREMRRDDAPSPTDDKMFRVALRTASKRFDIERTLHYFLATGNLKSQSGLDLQQGSGFTIMAERLNYWRFIAHYRSVHRGAFFMQLRTTAVRKLLPDSWGFICPVHTPDGSPCGLLSHLAAPCSVAMASPPRDALRALLLPKLSAAGAVLLPLGAALPTSEYLPLLLDGELVGRVHLTAAKAVVSALRAFKVSFNSLSRVPEAVAAPLPPDPAAPAARRGDVSESLASLEIALITPGGAKRPPGLYLYCNPARPLRPVRNLGLQCTELLSPMEQTTLRVAYGVEDVREGVNEATHCELSPSNMLSVIASLTPFCDFNQSPRNMYQCQMGKQTMGTPFHATFKRTETKSYHLHTPQSPIVRNENYVRYGFDEYAQGTNAIVAVISYSGYDMEDAMIVNKSSYERGFAHASVRTTKCIDLNTMQRRGEKPHHHFANMIPADANAKDGEGGPKLYEPKLGADGLPEVGSRLSDGDPIAVVVDEVSGKFTVKRHKSTEVAFVEEVRLVDGDASSGPCQRAFLKLRYNRNPVPGDKFASRSGQKGVLSRLFPAEDMPFSESGLVPDILFNPHGFPSRMTIGMLLESMAGKAGAMHGIRQDATPFTFSEKHRAVDYFGDQLRQAGYAYHGTESMYSGFYGTELKAHIFIGVVYYQRLRHMVSDKHQVRAKGPINPLTRQPVHGRKVHGGIRLGEMERDALLAHGVAFLVQDRLLRCSDEAKALICTKCQSLLSPTMLPARGATDRQATCRSCGDGKAIDTITIPYVFQYLTNELAAMNVRTKISTKSVI